MTKPWRERDSSAFSVSSLGFPAERVAGSDMTALDAAQAFARAHMPYFKVSAGSVVEHGDMRMFMVFCDRPARFARIYVVPAP